MKLPACVDKVENVKWSGLFSSSNSNSAEAFSVITVRTAIAAGDEMSFADCCDYAAATEVYRRLAKS